MAVAKGTRNGDRETGKAWGKSHGVEQKKVTDPAVLVKREARLAKKPVNTERGLSITLPKITWGWAEEVMVRRWPNTRRVRALDAYLALQKRGRPVEDESLPLVIETNPEVRASSAQPSKKSLSKKAASKNGR